MDPRAEAGEGFAAFPFTSRYETVGQYRIHYIEEGSGRPILFIHGNPTWSYQWRNIIPAVARQMDARCIAFDLLGFGRSDKPDIEYTFAQHAAIVDEFIEKKGLRRFVMVLHDWGAALGFWHAIHHIDNVVGIVFFEPAILTRSWKDYTGERRKRFELFRDKKLNYEAVQVRNVSIETLAERVLHKERMTEEVMKYYREPFPTVESRKAMRRFPEMLPIGEDSETFRIFREIEKGLRSLDFPVLLLTATPGSSIGYRDVQTLRDAISNLDVWSIGEGLHMVHEDQPDAISDAIVKWIRERRV